MTYWNVQVTLLLDLGANMDKAIKKDRTPKAIAVGDERLNPYG